MLSPEAPLLVLHEGAIHAEGPAWQASHDRLLFSDVPNRRLNAWYEDDGRVEVAIDATWFMNGNAVAADDAVWHCEHGRRCISRSQPDLAEAPEPIVTHFEGKRLNSPNDVAVAADGTIWFTDPIFGIAMPSQGALADPELDHRSVYRFDPTSGALARIADYEQPNGVALSADGATLYVSDTSVSLGEVPGFSAGDKHEVWRFVAAPDGSWGDGEFFCRTDHGYPDGFAVDVRGWLWVSAGDGVHVWSAEGVRLGYVPVGATVSNLCFGGSTGRRLFIAAQSRLVALDLKA
ncbi:SMP-30/gluconolactonase/LRE family protein [Sphingomonas dokdonensis]|uniref:SMP-30/gluconolactonase/LRE family protein n=1 Tax=Sphingomonas dokdonensis TaxID=344880 RepID=UPI001FE35E95|nr:SMP-30/gluconolactonase/LRE family protein [Sphingomonas dokdonensis]